MILYESNNSKVEWLEHEKIVVKTFYDFIYGEEMRGAFEAGFNALVTYHGIKWLSDNLGLKPYRNQDVTWINEDWFPRMLKAGWKYWAAVEPENILGKWSMKNFMDFYQQQGIMLVDAIAQNMHLPVFPTRAELHAGNKINANGSGCFFHFRQAL